MARRYMFLGDTHGDLDFVGWAADFAASRDVDEIICVGDWGFIWPGSHQVDALSRVLAIEAERHARPPLTMRFVDGNHDDHDVLGVHREAVALDRDGRVIYQPRGTVHEDADGTRFLFLGGAPSIDHANRVLGRDLWLEEEITDEQAERAMSVAGPVHVLVTHDAPDYPPGFFPRGDPAFRERSARSMGIVRRVAAHHTPELLAHGHWHHEYFSTVGPTRVAGLDCNLGIEPMRAVMIWERGA